MKDVGLSLAISRASNPPSPSGAQLNIAYGQTAPEDTSKIWVKADEPESLEVKYSKTAVSSENIIPIAPPPFSVNVDSIASDGNKVYIGNYTSSDYTSIADYDPQTNTYINRGRQQVYTLYNQSLRDCFCYNNKLYFYYYNSNTRDYYFRGFNLSDNTGIDRLGYVASGSYPSGAVVIGSNAYYTTGSNLYRYNLLTNANQSIASLRSSTNYKPIITAAGTDVYVLADSRDGYENYRTVLYKYDTLTGSFAWKIEMDPWTQGISGTVGFYDGQCIYYFSPQQGTNKIWKYDVSTNTMTKGISLTMPKNLSDPKVAVANNAAYIFSGTDAYKFYTSWDIPVGSAQMYLGNGDGSKKGYIINSKEVKQELNFAQYFYGDESGKSKKAPIYYHNGTDWVEFM